MNDAFSNYCKTYEGKELLRTHKLDEEGIWKIKGEDPNCDFGGPHHQPHLGYLSGKLIDVIHTAINMKGFWSWGGGGSIEKVEATPVLNSADLGEILKKKQLLEKELKQINRMLQK